MINDITIDTEIDELLKYTDVTSKMEAMDSEIQKYCSQRTDALSTQMANGKGCGPNQIVKKMPIYYQAAKKVKDDLDAVKELSPTVKNNISHAAIQQRIDELNKLIELLEEEVQGRNDNISVLERIYEYYKEKIENTNIIEKVKDAAKKIIERVTQQVILDYKDLGVTIFKTFMGAGLGALTGNVGIGTAIGGLSGMTYYITTIDDKVSALKDIYDIIKGAGGYIDQETAVRDKYQEKLDKARKELATANSELGSYPLSSDGSGDGTTSSNGGGSGSGGGSGNGSGDSRYKDDGSKYSKGDKVTVDGKEYTVVGYSDDGKYLGVTDENGNIYGVDSDGNATKAPNAVKNAYNNIFNNSSSSSSTVSKGDTIKLNGDKYYSVGSVKDSNGNNVGVYKYFNRATDKFDTCTIDSNGNVNRVYDHDIDYKNRTVTLNGKTYDLDTASTTSTLPEGAEKTE